MLAPDLWRNSRAERTSCPLTGRASNRMAAISWIDLSLKTGNCPALLLRSDGVASESQILSVAVRRTTAVPTCGTTVGGGGETP
jgi:hypothetical protein